MRAMKPDPLLGDYLVVWETTKGRMCSYQSDASDAFATMWAYREGDVNGHDDQRRYIAAAMYRSSDGERMAGWGPRFELSADALSLPVHTAHYVMSCGNCWDSIGRAAWFVAVEPPLCLPCGRQLHPDRVLI